MVLKQADQSRSVSLVFLVIAFALPLVEQPPLTPLAFLEGASPPPPLPIYLGTARLRI